MAESIIASNLYKSYPGGVQALDGLSFTVEEGTIFGLLGPNGAGKSTTVKILTTLSKPDKGEARVSGFDVLGDPGRVRCNIGYVAQNTGSDRAATGRENLMLQGRLYGMGGSGLKERVAQLLERFSLLDAADRVVSGYSGGMVRRLDIALGLVHQPQVLFMDEPTTGLDPEARVDMWHEISRLAGEEKLTILLTTHYLEEADRLAARLAIVDRGRIVAAGSPEQLKSELRGDALHIVLDTEQNSSAVEAALAGLTNVREITVEGSSLHARADEGAKAVPVVLQTLESAGITVDSVTVARPSLDDVYLRHAGRSFESAHSEGEADQAAAKGRAGGH